MSNKGISPEKIKEYNKRYYEKNKAVCRERNKAWADKNETPEYTQRKNLKNRYALSVDQYNTMLQQQNNKCAICKEIFSSKICVDHNHTTGKVRSLLCTPCNVGLGFFKENAETLTKAIEYLKEHAEPNP